LVIVKAGGHPNAEMWTMGLVYEGERETGENTTDFLTRLGLEYLEARHNTAVRGLVSAIRGIGEALESGDYPKALTLYQEWCGDE
jgi:hypothetical protein